MSPSAARRCYTTLLTRASYIPCVIILAHTLQQHGARYPLLVLVTDSLSAEGQEALRREGQHNPLLQVREIAPLMPTAEQLQGHQLVAERFADTWTKLRVFELTEFETVVFLDADTIVRTNVDDLFDIGLPAPDWLAAGAAGICNLDLDAWAPTNWGPATCGYTHGVAHTGTIEPPPLNSGVFVFRPSTSLAKTVLDQFRASTRLYSYACPDQDFMAEEPFRGRWKPLPWYFDAIKTMRQWHANLWTIERGDAQVRILHYICDKPHQKRIASDGIAGYLGRDGETHRWWWQIWDEWRAKRLEANDGRTVELVELAGPVAPALTSDTDRAQVQENCAKGFPVPIPIRPGMHPLAEEGVHHANRILGCEKKLSSAVGSDHVA